MLSQTFDDARAVAPGSSWEVPLGCHKAVQAILSSFKKRRRRKEQKSHTRDPPPLPAVLLSAFWLPVVNRSLEEDVSPSDGFYHLSSI